MSALERRYRRLLAAYPPAHRATYGEEMLGVLTESAAPGQRWPSARDTVVLLRHGASARLRSLGRAVIAPEWAHAAAIFGVVAALFLAARHLVTAARWVRWVNQFAPSTSDRIGAWLLVAVWLAAGAALLFGGRVVGTLAAIVAAAAEVYSLTWWPALQGGVPNQEVLQLAVALTAATALAFGTRWRGRVLHPAWLVALGATAALTLVAVPLRPGYILDPTLGLGLPANQTTDAFLLIAVIPVLVLMLSLPGALRRRLVALGAPVVAEAAYIHDPYGWQMYADGSWYTDFGHGSWYTDYGHGSWYTDFGMFPGPTRLVALAIPALTFLVCALWAARRDRVAHLLALGRAAERAPHADAREQAQTAPGTPAA